MSLYYMQKLLYGLNRDPALQQRYQHDRAVLLDEYPLSSEEHAAFAAEDIGQLYVLGAHPSLLVHFASLVGVPLSELRATLQAGVARHGAVRAGVLAQ